MKRSRSAEYDRREEQESLFGGREGREKEYSLREEKESGRWKGAVVACQNGKEFHSIIFHKLEPRWRKNPWELG